MRRKIVLAIAVLVIAIIIWAVVDQQNRIRRENEAFQIQAGETLTLYSIDGTNDLILDSTEGANTGQLKPHDNVEFLEKYPVLGKVEISDAKLRDQIISDVNHGLRKGVWIIPFSCFWPRHALRITTGNQIDDYLICFECGQIQVVDKEGGTPRYIRFSSKSQKQLDHILSEAKIPLAPSKH